MPSTLNLDRKTLAQILQGNARAIAAFEQLQTDVGITLPTTVEEANALAGSALAVAQAASAALVLLADALVRLETMPAAPQPIDPDDVMPRAHLGTISAQNADQVEITGGTINGTPIGQNTEAAAKFTTVAASGQITSSIATGSAPLVVTSTTKVSNLYVDRAALADHATAADGLTSPSSYPADATDLPTAITLVNALKGAATSKGL